VNQLELREAHRGPAILELIKGYRDKLETELTDKCKDILEVLGRTWYRLLPNRRAKFSSSR